MADAGHEMTDELLKEMERKVKREYEQAYRETHKKLKAYWKDIEKKATEQRELLDAGKITKKEYDDWMLRHAAMSKRWEDIRDNLAQDFYNSNKIARNIIEDGLPDVYALNHNYATYQIEHSGGIDTAYTLYDKQTAERLIKEEQILMPPPSPRRSAQIARKKAMQWNKQALQSALVQGILQGESITEIASRVSRTVAVRNYNDSVRYARTMYTSAENAGRYNGYGRAESMGVNLTIEWCATLDGRTRHDHRMMHGQRRDFGEPFETPDGYTIYYPADCTGESTAPQSDIWNCRCTLLAWVKGFEGDTVKSSPKMGEMSFEEWQNEHKPDGEPTVTMTAFKNAKLKKAMGADYGPFSEKVSESDARPLWDKYADNVGDVEITESGGGFSPYSKSIEACYEEYNDGIDRYSTIAHEYGHLFDYSIGRVDGINYNQVDTINMTLIGKTDGNFLPFKVMPSSSDGFMEALRADMKTLKPKMAKLSVDWSWAKGGVLHDATSSVQDALDGFYGTQKKGLFSWGHGDAYYNRIYNRQIKEMGFEKELKKAFNSLGLDASNQQKVKNLTRQYKAASEAWANVNAAVTCGGKELEAMEQYMPNTLAEFRRIAKLIRGM